jgi:hypothetical protein
MTTHPHDADTWFRRGVVEMLSDRKRDATVSFTEAVRYEHSLMEAWALLCTLWAQLGKPEAVQVAARRVLALRPDLAPIISQAALLLQQNNASFEALDVIEATTKTGFVTVELARAHAKLLGEMGFPDEAANSFRAIWRRSQPQTR